MQVLCKTCNKQFYAKPSFLKLGFSVYCSRSCFHSSLIKAEEYECFTCGSVVLRTATKAARSKSGKFFCTKSCQTKWRNRVFSGERHANWVHGMAAYQSVLGRHGIKKECWRCKSDDPRIMVIHHIDRNRRNSDVKNLLWMCHNCHFLIHHDRVEEGRLMEALV